VRERTIDWNYLRESQNHIPRLAAYLQFDVKNRIPDGTLKLLTGHKTDEMLEYYTHIDIEMVHPVIAAANEAFWGVCSAQIRLE